VEVLEGPLELVGIVDLVVFGLRASDPETERREGGDQQDGSAGKRLGHDDTGADGRERGPHGPV